MSTTDVYIVVIQHRSGKRTARREPLKVPLNLALGRLERLSDLALKEAVRDLTAEQERRNGPAKLAADPTWNPYDAVRQA